MRANLQARSELLQLPSFEEGRLLKELEQWFYRLTARRFDRELSLEIIGTLKEAYDVTERRAFAEILGRFAEQHLDKLETIYDDYRLDDRCSPLLFQPEALMVFERLEHDEFRLKDVWCSKLPEILLSGLSMVWGRSI